MTPRSSTLSFHASLSSTCFVAQFFPPRVQIFDRENPPFEEIHPKIRISNEIYSRGGLDSRYNDEFLHGCYILRKIICRPIEPHATFRRTLQIKMCFSAIIEQETRCAWKLAANAAPFSTPRQCAFETDGQLSDRLGHRNGSGDDDARARVLSRNPLVFSVIYETASVWFSGSL